MLSPNHQLFCSYSIGPECEKFRDVSIAFEQMANPWRLQAMIVSSLIKSLDKHRLEGTDIENRLTVK
jgi:hypothetical protein